MIRLDREHLLYSKTSLEALQNLDLWIDYLYRKRSKTRWQLRMEYFLIVLKRFLHPQIFNQQLSHYNLYPLERLHPIKNTSFNKEIQTSFSKVECREPQQSHCLKKPSKSFSCKKKIVAIRVNSTRMLLQLSCPQWADLFSSRQKPRKFRQ